MFAYNPVTQNKSGEIYAKNIMYSAEVESEAKQRAAAMNAQAQQQMVGDIGGALMGLAGMYAGSVEKKDALKGMDTAVMGMSDLGAITPDFRDSYLNADDRTRPFLFQALASPMFQSYNAGQSAAAQAQAWDQYKTKWGSNAGGGGPMPFTY